MYVRSSHAKETSWLTLARALVYSVLPPEHRFVQALKDRFGSHALTYLNTESALSNMCKHLPGRHPGMVVAVDRSHAKRFTKIIKRHGLKTIEYAGQRELKAVLGSDRLIAVILPEGYDMLSRLQKRAYRESKAYKIVYQNRVKPRRVSLEHHVFIWEPRCLPRSVSGAVTVFTDKELDPLWLTLKAELAAVERLPRREFIRELWQAKLGRENRYRRVDRRPSRLMPRMLYDLYK